MVASLLITLREGLEAALIVGIMLSALRKLGQMRQARAAWAGVTAAAKRLVGLGYTQVYELEGGMNAWQTAGKTLLRR